MTRCAWQADVACFLLGGLTPSEEHATMAHLAGCPTCRATLTEFINLPTLLDRVPRSLVELVNRSTSTLAARS